MTLVPRLLLDRWMRLRLYRQARRLGKIDSDRVAQQATFTALMRRFARTHFGHHHGLTASLPYAQFRSSLPPQTYADIAPFITRLAAGEPDILTPGHCRLFVETAGTTGPTPKLIPVTQAQLAHGRKAWQQALLLYAQRVGHTRIFRGKHLLSGTTPEISVNEKHYQTSLGRLLALFLGPWAATRQPVAHSPRQLTDFPADLSVIAGTPSSLATLTRQLCPSTPTSPLTSLQKHWPQLECLVITAAPSRLLADELRQLAGPTTHTHEVYLAAEAIIAAQDQYHPPGLRLLTDTGVFFEFLPLADFNPATLDQAGPRCRPLTEIEPGIDYVLLLTTPAGLCRYILGDVVRFASVKPPRLATITRLHTELNLCGEHVNEHELVDALLHVCHSNNWRPVSVHVAPYAQRIAAGQMLACHEWWLELQTHSLKTPTANVLAPALDAALAQRNPTYAEKRARNQLGPPWIRLVMPGVFSQWARQHHPALDPSKLPACRSDRQIADQIAALAGFHAATVPQYRAADARPPA